MVSIFFDYPVSDFYSNHYTFRFFREKIMSWSRPVLSGLIIFNGRLIIKFSTAKRPEDFISESQDAGVREFFLKANETKDLLRAEEASFAGILPGVFYRKKLIRDRNSSVVTATVVCDAVDKVFFDQGLPIDFPVVSLGGAGFIGRTVAEEMKKRGRTFYVVDLKEDSGSWPEILANSPVVVLNLLSDNSGLDRYLNHFSSGSIFINEAYPPPDKSFISIAKSKGVVCYHVCGAQADFVWPPFPGHYRGAEEEKSIPCCAVPFSSIKQGAKPVLHQF